MGGEKSEGSMSVLVCGVSMTTYVIVLSVSVMFVAYVQTVQRTAIDVTLQKVH